MDSFDFQWISDNAALKALCEQLSEQTVIALDTEFIRSKTYYPHLGLLQIADAYGIYLVDPLAISNLQPLAQILTNPSIVKVVHACSEDLEVFQYALGVLPATLFDTQIAAGFAGYGVSIGYANLLKKIKDIDISKQETRSDWMQRPLSDPQLHYAALDVAYLLEIYQVLLEKLQNLNRIDWVEFDCDAIVEKLRNTNHEEQYYARVKSAWKLKPHQLAVLKTLCRWREQQAREQDVPRSRVLKDSSLFDLALRLPKNLNQLKRIQDMYSRLVSVSGQTILRLIADVLDEENDDIAFPERLPRPLSTEQTSTLKLLKQYVGSVAESLDVPQELLVRKKDYEELLRSSADQQGVYQLPSSLTDWRQEVIGSALINHLKHMKNIS